jgi:diguanylate cyclase (GGDEF)-like protein
MRPMSKSAAPISFSLLIDSVDLKPHNLREPLVPNTTAPAKMSFTTTEASFEPYAQLLRSLMPSMRGMAIHDGFGNLVWASDDWMLSNDDKLVRNCIANALSDPGPLPAVMRSYDADCAVYSFALRGEHIDLIGIVSLAAAAPSAMGAPRSLQYVRQLAQPALECLKREIALRSTLGSRERELGVRERDLDTMFQISSASAGASIDADEYSLILKTGLEHTSCQLAALWVPDKDIRQTVSRGGQTLVPDALKRAEQHLLAWMRLQQRTIVINRVAHPAGEGSTRNKILACPIRHASERVIGVLAFFNPPSAEDFDPHQTRIAELLAKRAAVAIQAKYDSGTGLPTRQTFEEQAKALFSLSVNLESHSILYLDIDRLHVINETFGMHVGDEVIVSVADALARSVPPKTLSARISGDRLAALLPNKGLEEAGEVADAVRKAAAAIVPRVGHGSFQITVSIGVAPVCRSDSPLAHALATAEIACKAAKDRGRNRVEVFQDSDHSIIRRHTDILVIGQLRSALDENAFLLDAQPILPLRGAFGRPRFELLLRMVGDRGEIIPPGKFLPAAERYQLMPTIDRWVVRRSCELLGSHSATTRGDIARFAINLSGQSLQDDAFLDFVTEQISANHLPPSALCFELTETATVGNLQKAQAFIGRLQNLGCQFALDDFGTGVSSLAYLKDLSVNYVKIDGSFVRDIIGSPRSESMIKAIAQLAKVMGMETIAEYVETDALRARVAELGVDYGQGFAMGKAQRLESLLSELAAYEAIVTTKCEPAEVGGA